MVQLSGRGADHVGDPRYLTSERAVKESGMDWTILRPSSFYQNFDEGFFRDAVLSGSLILPVGEGKESFIDAWDIAEVAVAALTDSRHAGCTYELTGPRAYSLSEAFSLISAAAGREITFADIAPVEFNTGLIARGFPKQTSRFSMDTWAWCATEKRRLSPTPSSTSWVNPRATSSPTSPLPRGTRQLSTRSIQ